MTLLFNFVSADVLRAKLVERRTFIMGEQQATRNGGLIELLLTDEVSSVSMSWLPREKNFRGMKSVTDAWFSMSKKCPRLKKIECKNFYRRNSQDLFIFLSISLHFKHLQVLNMTDVECTDVRLGLLARHLRQLR
jgi:hypothetical protein